MLADVGLPNIWHNLGSTSIALTPSLLVGASLFLYLLGAYRVPRIHPGESWSVRRTWAFVGAMAVTFFSIELVIGVYDDSLYYDHMIQHLLLVMVAAPLIAMGAPLELLSKATTGKGHRFVVRLLDSKVAEVIGHPVTGFALYAVVIPIAHLTSVYNFALQNDLAHDNEHLGFLIVGYLFWRHVVAVEPRKHPMTPPVRLLFLMAAVPVDTFTGLTLTTATHEMFSAYLSVHRSWGPSLVSDLHIGGSIMWVGGDTLMVGAMVPVVVQWVRYEEERARRIDAELDAADAELVSTDIGLESGHTEPGSDPPGSAKVNLTS
jgi:cytochrome c oxidase assembly factor CtaG